MGIIDFLSSFQFVLIICVKIITIRPTIRLVLIRFLNRSGRWQYSNPKNHPICSFGGRAMKISSIKNVLFACFRIGQHTLQLRLELVLLLPLSFAVLHEVLQDLAKAGDGGKFQNEGRTCCGVIPCRSKASISAAPISPS